MSTDNDIWSRQLVGGLDALPLTDATPIPTPHYEYVPPDSAEFNRDMATLARMERWMWGHALWGKEGRRPEMPDDDLLCDFIPGCEVELFLVSDDDKVTELIAADIEAWSVTIAAATERAIAEITAAVA